MAKKIEFSIEGLKDLQKALEKLTQIQDKLNTSSKVQVENVKKEAGLRIKQTAEQDRAARYYEKLKDGGIFIWT